MPTKRTKISPPSRTKRASSAPKILSSQEKRELILAHAAARQPMDPTHRLTLWAGISLCVVFLVVAWAYTVGGEIRKSWAKPLDPAIQEALDGGRKIGEEFQKSAEDVSALDQQVEEISEKLSAMVEQERMLEAMAEQLQATSTDAEREDLFQPHAATGTSL